MSKLHNYTFNINSSILLPGVLYHRWKKYELAEHMYENALKINPNFRSAEKNLNTVKKIKALKYL